jgi:hypothetical protein
MALMTFASDFTGRTTLNCCRSELMVCESFFGDVPGEIIPAESEIENDSATLRIAHDRQHLSTFVNHLSQIAVIEVCDHVAGFGNTERLGCQ